jgi:polyisoprenoid-binding protein YceI
MLVGCAIISSSFENEILKSSYKWMQPYSTLSHTSLSEKHELTDRPISTPLKVSLKSNEAYHAFYAKIVVKGTSTLHNWNVASENAVCDIAFKFDGANITGLSSILFTVGVKTLKSDHKAMSKNMYKALNSEKFPEITYHSSYANIRATGKDAYVISAKGELTISGVSKNVWLAAVTTVNPTDMSVQTIGSIRIKMSEYKIDPPSLMLGTVNVGDEITVQFNLNLKK